MKKIAVIFFTIFYILPAIGFGINVHWCGGKVSSVSIGVMHEKKCACGKEMKKGCCKDIKTIIKLTDSQKETSSLTSPKNNLSSAILFTLPERGLFYSYTGFSDFFTNHAPLLISEQPVYLSCRAFRI